MKLEDLSNSIYVINLESRIDRKNHIIKQLENISCKNYTLFKAVDGSLIYNSTKLKNGMLGLVKTYLNIYEDWVTRNSDSILLIEDDCIFDGDFNVKLKEYMENVPSNWEMVYFGANHNYHIGGKTNQINEYCIKLNNSYSAHCVLMKGYVFKELIENIKTFTVENDVMMANLQKKYNSYSSINPLTSQIESYSNIENRLVNYDWLIK